MKIETRGQRENLPGNPNVTRVGLLGPIRGVGIKLEKTFGFHLSVQGL